jgi:hypothetical protein
MSPLSQWSLAKVLLVCGSWVALCLLLLVAWILFQFRSSLPASSGSSGIGFISFGINVLVLAIPVLPPLLLVAAWLLARWLSRSPGVV